jgi:uncharacterized membrane protein YccC
VNALLDALLQHLANVAHEIRATRFTGPRARFCARTALSIVLAVTLAQWASLDNAWWAGISGFMASQATGPASIQRGILRIIVTVIGAAIAYVAMGLIAYDHVALCLFLFAAGTLGVLGMSVSPHGYAWLFGGLTANMIVMMAMNDPAQTPFIAFDRVAEVTLGCAAAVLMALVLAPRGDDAPAPPPAAPGWTDLLGARWPAVEHALRSGVTIMLLPIIWNVFDLPSLTQMAVTVSAVMAVPVSLDDPRAAGRTVVGRAGLRLLGCLWGGAFGLLCLALPLTMYPLWLAVLFAGVWICAHVGSSKDAISYAGIQACVVFIVTLVQGPGPPDSILPGIDRFAGITGGLAVLLVIGLTLWPSPRAQAPD